MTTKDGENYINLGDKQQLTLRGLTHGFEGNSVRKSYTIPSNAVVNLSMKIVDLKKAKYKV